jgi:hypothetical protein
MLLNPWKASTLILAGALCFTSLPEAGADGQNQPHMYAALENLNAAQTQLAKGSSDKGGHRAAAMRLTRDAIAQVKKGIAFDKTH